MNSFKHAIAVTAEDIDELGHVNNVVYVRWIQEVSAAHWIAISSKELRDQYLWAVLRHEIDYKNPCFVNDTVIGTTWVGEHHGAKFERFVQLYSEQQGQVVAKSKTTWCLLDKKSMRPLRIPEAVLSLL